MKKNTAGKNLRRGYKVQNKKQTIYRERFLAFHLKITEISLVIIFLS
jgi:hypothetical protein